MFLDHESAARRLGAFFCPGAFFGSGRRRFPGLGEIAFLRVPLQRFDRSALPGERFGQGLLEREHRRKQVADPRQASQGRRRREKKHLGILGTDQFDAELDFDIGRKYNVLGLGTAGPTVFDEDTDMVAVARNIASNRSSEVAPAARGTSVATSRPLRPPVL